MTEFTGTWFLIRFALRRDWLRTLMWMGGITALISLTVVSLKDLFPTQTDLDQVAAASAGNAAVIVSNGPVQGLDTLGGEVAFQSGTLGLILVALMSLLTVTRYTRSEEESGRTELLRATVLGRDAHAAAAFLLVAGMNLLVGMVVTVGLLAQGLPAVGSVSFGVSFLAIGLVFAALTLVTTQITEHSRVASGVAGAVLGYAFVMRAIGDLHNGHLSWLSPIGWSQKLRPFAGERWWPGVVPAVAVIVLLLTARALSERRDWGAGLVRPRPGPARGTTRLGSPLGLAVRLNQVGLMAWTASLLIVGSVYGAIADDVSRFVGDNQVLKDVLAAEGGLNLTDAYFGTTMLTLALIGCCYPLQVVQRLRSEESALYAEAVLATPTSRMRWLGGHLAVSGGGSLVVMTAAGLGVGVPYAVVTHDAHHVPLLLGAALVYLPAIWLLVGLSVMFHGVAPRILTASWLALVGCFTVGFLGQVLKLPHWIVQLSPFQHTPQLPAATLSVAPLAAQTACAAVFIVIGALAFRHRDLG